MAERFVVDIQVSPDLAVVVEAFFTAKERLEQMREPMLDAAQAYANAIRARFESQDFEPLSSDTRKSVGVRGSEFILVDTGTMEAAATSALSWDVVAGESKASATFDPSLLASVAPYFRFHLSGTDFMPERDFLAIDEVAVERSIDLIFERFVSDSIEAVAA